MGVQAQQLGCSLPALSFFFIFLLVHTWCLVEFRLFHAKLAEEMVLRRFCFCSCHWWSLIWGIRFGCCGGGSLGWWDWRFLPGHFGWRFYDGFIVFLYYCLLGLWIWYGWRRGFSCSFWFSCLLLFLCCWWWGVAPAAPVSSAAGGSCGVTAGAAGATGSPGWGVAPAVASGFAVSCVSSVSSVVWQLGLRLVPQVEGWLHLQLLVLLSPALPQSPPLLVVPVVWQLGLQVRLVPQVGAWLQL